MMMQFRQMVGHTRDNGTDESPRVKLGPHMCTCPLLERGGPLQLALPEPEHQIPSAYTFYCETVRAATCNPSLSIHVDVPGVLHTHATGREHVQPTLCSAANTMCINCRDAHCCSWSCTFGTAATHTQMHAAGTQPTWAYSCKLRIPLRPRLRTCPPTLLTQTHKHTQTDTRKNLNTHTVAPCPILLHAYSSSNCQRVNVCAHRDTQMRLSGPHSLPHTINKYSTTHACSFCPPGQPRAIRVITDATHAFAPPAARDS
eukprot:GDKI01040506.1.p1 GENE.GDKI01040506.1~~GDKI01040506.1.p1  ORF type:complete len:258 (-),score=25.66 GDKI01040506.1:22-795(-)